LFFKDCFQRKQFNSFRLKKKKPVKKNLFLNKSRLKFYRHTALGMLFFFLLFMINPFISYGRYIPPPLKKSAVIKVRTQKWVHIQIAEFSGYTPINISIPAPGSYKLKWQKQNTSGVKYIHLKSGETITLRDHDF